MFNLINRHSGKLFLAGVALVAVMNARKWHPAPQHESSDATPLSHTPHVNVLVAAWNEADGIAAHIESFLRLRYPAKRLIVCAGGTDNTYALAKQYAGDTVTVLEQHSGEGKQRALSRGFDAVDGEIVVLTDADCLLNDVAFERALAPIIDDNAAATTGASQPTQAQQSAPFVAYQWAVDAYTTQHAPDASPGLMGRNCAIRTDVLREIGAFAVPAPSGTDYTLARQLLKAGYTIQTVRDSAVETTYPADIQTYFYKRSRWLRNLMVIGMQSGDMTQTRYGLQSALVGIFLLGAPFAALVMGSGILALWLILVIHACFARVRYVYQHPAPIPKGAAAVWGAAALGVDALVWTSALIQTLVPRWRNLWR